MTLMNLYVYIKLKYGHKKCTIHGLATLLGITDKQANHLTYTLGYRQSIEKANGLNSFAYFSSDIEVQKIQQLIS